MRRTEIGDRASKRFAESNSLFRSRIDCLVDEPSRLFRHSKRPVAQRLIDILEVDPASATSKS